MYDLADLSRRTFSGGEYLISGVSQKDINELKLCTNLHINYGKPPKNSWGVVGL